MEGYVGNQTVGCVKDIGLCPDLRTQCDGNGHCVQQARVPGWQCRCNVGWAGNGYLCGLDSDLDGLPDQELPCNYRSCKAVCVTSLSISTCIDTVT